MKTLLAILTLSLISPSARAEKTPDEAFFPLQQGFSWVYETYNKKEKERFDMKVTVEGGWGEDALSPALRKVLMQQGFQAGKTGTISGMILAQKDKRGRMREFLLKSEKGIFIYKIGLKKSV